MGAAQPASLGAVTFGGALGRVLRQSLHFSGRARRIDVAAYAIAALWLVPMALTLGELASGQTMPRLAELAIGVVLALPFPALFVRRCHDMGRSGRWLWLVLPGLVLPLARGLTTQLGGLSASQAFDSVTWPLDWLAIATNLAALALCALPGTPGENAFGPDPR